MNCSFSASADRECHLVGMEQTAQYCPITHEMMLDPVMCADGFTYERAAIQQWFETGQDRSPMTNKPLEHQHMIPNGALREIIEAHGQLHQEASSATHQSMGRTRCSNRHYCPGVQQQRVSDGISNEDSSRQV